MTIVGPTDHGLLDTFQRDVLDTGLADRAARPIAAMLLLYGVLQLSWTVASYVGNDSIRTGFLTALVVLGLATAQFAKLNYLTLHRYYRDRLMKAFQPTMVPGERPGITRPDFRATTADNGWLMDMTSMEDPRGIGVKIEDLRRGRSHGVMAGTRPAMTWT